ncbi:hypothetical protein FNO01nite_32380 [Flavobacterium noncentrifugens]|uniref:Fibronectin type-III domain-containing protein n=1 Tax=Flavobacterium noncentrifugens TaxID=1128970 RepID=A0A1G9D8E1_9FLAO|nr:hypothetical protein [Flavobacterium noncentrifugens]GEP52566.1 hypothetical protein FNO01nite_32380 [Flavobacterium noncentrifugens]SDK60157.1 hypothetical protein SAMN04487935_3743 [Flavobacterium noncentrifugens]
MSKSKFFIFIIIVALGFNFIGCDNEPIDPAISLENPETEACASPALLAVSDFIGGNKVNVSWDGDGETWQIQYGIKNFAIGSGTAVTATTNPTSITGLDSTKEYDFYIRTVCSATEFSEWVGPVAVGNVIINTCDIPSNVTAIRGATNNTVVNVTWASTASSNWEVQYGAAGFALGAGTIVPSATPTKQITGLLAANGYDFYVRTVCSATSSSTWAGPVHVDPVGTTNPGTIDTTPALMTANIDGVQYNVLRPFFYQVLGNDINVENDGADPGVPRFIKLQGTDNTTTVNTNNSREINLYIPDTMWTPGTYPLHWETGFEDPLCWVRFVVFSVPDIDARITDGSLTVTEFNRTTKRIKGTFEFTYEKINDDGDVIGTARVTNGTFNYGLDDPYFD